MYLEDIIQEEQNGWTVKRYLGEWRRFSSHMVRRLKFRENGILLNDAKVTVRAGLHKGDCLRMRLSDVETDDESSHSVWWLPPKDMPKLVILKEDPHLIFLDKPAGLVCHPSHGHYADTVANQVAEHLGIRRGGIYPIGRLDRDTSGVVCFAKHEDAAGQMTLLQKCGAYHKTYLTEVEGCLEGCGEITDSIGILKKTPLRMGLLAVDQGGRPAETYWKVRGYRRDDRGEICSTFLEVTISHGRTHQIRVHMASIGHPIVGDPIYGKDGDFRYETGRDAYDGTRHVEDAFAGYIDPAGVDMHLHAYRATYLEPFYPGEPEESYVETKYPAWWCR